MILTNFLVQLRSAVEGFGGVAAEIQFGSDCPKVSNACWVGLVEFVYSVAANQEV